MKRLLPFSLSICILSTIISNAQEPEFGILNANNILTGMSSNGSMFFGENQEGLFIAPNVGGVDNAASIFAGHLWLGGEDFDGNVIGVGNTYYQENGVYRPGPLTDQGETIGDIDSLFNRVWSITRTDILALQEDLQDGSLDFPIAKDILEWPAKGNPYFQDVFLNQDGAPFFDRNSNGKYEPADGDYPVVKGLGDVIPDQLLFVMFNDQNEPNFMQFNSKARVEVHLFMYAFDCMDNLALKNTVFTRHTVINKRQENIFDFYAGLFVDYDLGCYTDDFMGCDPEKNLMYVYNSDALDGEVGNECAGNVDTYLEGVPVQTTQFLNVDMSSYAYFNNPGNSINPPPQTVDPDESSDLYNYLRGFWRDGTPMTFGGTGFNPTSSDTTRFLFPGNPSNSTEWSMLSANLSSGDRRSIGSTSHGTFQAGEFINIDVAYVFNKKEGEDHLGNVNFALDQSTAIQTAYDQNFINVCTQNLECTTEDCVYPGDVNNNEIVERTDWMLHGIANAKSGQSFESPRSYISSRWDAFDADARSENFKDGVNYKHADCNGDGLINSVEDLESISANFGLSSDLYQTHEETATAILGGNFELLTPDVVDIDQAGFFVPNVLISDLENFHSVSYFLEYDPTTFEPLFTIGNHSVSGVFESALGMAKLLEPGKIIVVKGNDTVGDTTINLMTDQFLLSLIDGVGMGETVVKISNILIADYDENFYTMGDVEETVFLVDETSSTTNLELEKLKIFPNPTYGNIFFESDADLSHYQLFDMRSKRMQEGKIQNNQIVLDQLSGLYAIQIFDMNGNATLRKVFIE